MTTPYGYPPFLYPTPYLWPYFQQQPITPFIPPSVQLPPSPNAGAGTRRVHFEDEDYRPVRPRPPSWHAGMAGMAPVPNPAPFPSPPAMYTSLPTVYPVPVGPPQGYAHHRRRSDSVLPQFAWTTVPTWYYPVPQAPVHTPQLHPLLNAEFGHEPLILFDLSLNHYDPKKISAPGQTNGVALTREDLSSTACYPAVTKMTIVIDELPEWTVPLAPYQERPSNSGYLSIPAENVNAPITVNDVLFAIHKMLQRQISHRDWVALSNEKATAVARAYTRRCRTFPTTQQFEESQGVRRVDYLLDRYMFKGLVRQPGQQGFEQLRLIVGRR